MTRSQSLPDLGQDMAASVRNLLRSVDRAALATALRLPAGPAGGDIWPYASLVLVAVDHDLSPIVLLSDLAEHTRAIMADARVSLLFDGTAGLGQPLSGPRVSVLGRAAGTDDERVKQRFLARHPDAAIYAGFGDFRFYRLAIERAHLVGGFGKIRWLGAAELLPEAPPPDLVAAEAAIVAHMNEDHAEAVALYASRLLKRPGSGWRMTGIDRDGIDLRAAGEIARLALPLPVSGSEEARKALIALAARARGA